MAQRAEKEEIEFKVPETLSHCVNNCGVTGNASTNMCQKCFNAASAPATTSSSSSSATILKFFAEKILRSTSSFNFEASTETFRKTMASEMARSDELLNRCVVNRCSGCWRKVGLTGFRCRCVDLFCSEHRYSDRHMCSYKVVGRERKPVVKAAK